MNMPKTTLLEMSIVPLCVGESVSAYVARCVKLVEKSGLDYELHAMGTIVEGRLDQVLTVMQQCIEAVAEDCNRVTCTAKLDLRIQENRTDKKPSRLQSKIESVKKKLE